MGFARRALSFSLAALLAGFMGLAGAMAQEPRERPEPEFKPRLKQVAPGRCQQQMCDWFSIESADYLGASEKGWLFRLETRWWRSPQSDGYERRAPRRDAGERTIYVLCSKSEPALIEPPESAGARYRAVMLAPGDARAVTGALETQLALYWLACHNAVIEDVYAGGSRLARRLGYSIRAPQGGFAPRLLSEPMDALRW
jgi:hypothetical protein